MLSLSAQLPPSIKVYTPAEQIHNRECLQHIDDTTERILFALGKAGVSDLNKRVKKTDTGDLLVTLYGKHCGFLAHASIAKRLKDMFGVLPNENAKYVENQESNLRKILTKIAGLEHREVTVRDWNTESEWQFIQGPRF